MSAPEIVLTQNRVHKSIKGMQPTTLPAFTLLTGINGSGKSHLLDAIQVGAISTNITNRPATEIGFFDWNSLVPNDTGSTNITQVYSHRDWFIKHLRSRRGEKLPRLLDTLAQYGIDQEYAQQPWDALRASEEDLRRLGVAEHSIHEVVSAIQHFETDLKDHVRGSMGDDYAKRGLFEQFVAQGQEFHSLNYLDFDRQAFASYGPSLFQHSFGELFFGYFDKQRANIYGEHVVAKGEKPVIEPLKEEEFVAKHGRPPWDFVNDMLEKAKLDFRIDCPTNPQATEYLPKLTKLSSGAEVQFAALSSGERILMSLAFCLYNSTDKRQNIKRPKLILFDEIDAPLHPSMSRVLVDIISNVLVGEEAIPVIMVTHSPSTVAVSPDNCIHLLTANPTRITKESKRQAVSVLTAEIPTMSIDFSGRRQVFVESDFDAERYQVLFQILAPHLKSERSLSFIGVGHVNMNNGCAQVIRTVTALEEAQNKSVLGLIDWDKQNNPTARVHVLGHEVRYAIENYLLDPVLVAAALLNANPSRTAVLGLDQSDTFAAFSSLGNAKLQAACNIVQSKVLAEMAIAGPADVVKAAYFGGEILDADRRYHLAHGHDLENFVKGAFPELKRFHQTGDLLFHIADIVIRNHPNLIPKDIAESILEMCNADLK